MSTPTFDVTDLSDLQAFLDRTTGPYASLVIPAISAVENPDERLLDAWQHARRSLGDEWSSDVLDDVDNAIRTAGHREGDALAVVIPTRGAALVEHLAGSPGEVRTNTGTAPAFTPIIEHRQRTIPHLVVECDKTGADIAAFDGGAVLATDRVDGEDLHIHRGHPGGWSQRRYQQRAENTWESNIADIADEVVRHATSIKAKLIAVVGPTRSKSMLVTELNDRNAGDIAKGIEAGDIDGIATEVVTLTDTVHAQGVRDMSAAFAERAAQGTAIAKVDLIASALAEGRVESLLVVDDWSDMTLVGESGIGDEADARVIDAAIGAALGSSADVVIVPAVASLDGSSLGAMLRW